MKSTNRKPRIIVSIDRPQSGDQMVIIAVDGTLDNYRTFLQKVCKERKKGRVVRYIAIRADTAGNEEKYTIFACYPQGHQAS